MSTLELPGFADPVLGAQACFRALLESMARPGRLHEIAPLAAPPPLGPAMAASLLTLIDGTTPLWLDTACAEASEWLLFHCGAPLVADPAEAAFAAALALPPLSAFSAGTDAAPEESATLIVQVPGLGTGAAYRLSGPGLKTPSLVRISGLPADFSAQWAANRALCPRGVDLVLCADNQLCALPRSVRIEQA